MTVKLLHFVGLERLVLIAARNLAVVALLVNVLIGIGRSPMRNCSGEDGERGGEDESGFGEHNESA